MTRRAEREKDQIVVPADDTRAREMGGFFIRETLLKKMRQGIDAGLAFPDAAQAAGIPYELVLVQLGHDDELRQWYAECSGRKSIIRREDAHLLPETRTPLQHKHDLLNKLFSAGLGDRFAEAAAHIRVIDPATGGYDKEGMNVLGFFGKFVLNHLLPKEIDNTQRDAEKEPEKELTETQLAQRLVELREKRLSLEGQRNEAKKVRETGGQRLKGPEVA